MNLERGEKNNPEEREKLSLRPGVIVLSGVPLSGKTYLAERLKGIFDLDVVDVDEVRHEIDESRRQDGQIKMLEPEQERAIMVRAYAEMCQRAETLVDAERPVLISGTFSRAEFKQPLEEMIGKFNEQNIPFKVFLLSVPDEEVLQRIEKRRTGGSLSNIDSLDKYRWAKGIFGKIEFAPVKEIDISKPESFDQVLENLKDLEIK